MNDKIKTDFKQLIKRRTKIVATMGPAGESPEVMRALMEAGVNVFRLNMSHGTHEEHQRRYYTIREQAFALGKPVAVLADLCGPKIRTGTFPDGRITLEQGQSVTITTRAVDGAPGLIHSQYAALHQDVKPGDPILLDDGNLELKVTAVDGQDISADVIFGGVLKNHKGMNLPASDISAPALTEKDRKDAQFAADLGVDYLALSFVRRARDVEDLLDLLGPSTERPHIISKIEKPEALDNIQEILNVSDGIMVARGDLGVEMPPQTVPLAQDQLVTRAARAHKPVIVATQMLESMISNPRPTRAEVSDISHAVASGTDGIMLSAETAVGDHPLEAVRMMDVTARQMEGFHWEQSGMGRLYTPLAQEPPLDFEQAMARATAQMSRDLLVRAVVVISRTGTSIRMVSSARPSAPVLAVTPSPSVWRRSALLWGVVPILTDEAMISEPTTLACKTVLEEGLGEPGQSILIVKGFSEDSTRNQPTITIASL